MSNLNKLKRMFSVRNGTSVGTSNEVNASQVGFKISFCETGSKLRVKVIGARQLPTLYGSIKPVGYLVKVRVFPGKDKFETDLVKESWASFNQEFEFTLSSNGSAPILVGKFVSLTAYAVLEHLEEQQKANSLKGYLGLFSNKEADTRKLKRQMSLNKRRTVGVATYSLDPKCFTEKLKNYFVATPDIWRNLEQISSGIEIESKESKKGTLEVTLTYSKSEDGENDSFELSLSKLRCSMQTMQNHEKYGGQLYLKITAYEYDVLIAKLKSDRFQPTISLKMEPTTSTLLTTVNRHNLEQVRFLIRLMCKNMLGKKFLLGKINIDSTRNMWKEVVETPSNPVTRLIDLE